MKGSRTAILETMLDSGLPMLELVARGEKALRPSWKNDPPAERLELREHVLHCGGNLGIRTGPVFGAEMAVVALVGEDLPDIETWRIGGPRQILLFRCPDVCPTTIKLETGAVFVGHGGFVPAPGSQVREELYKWVRGPRQIGSHLVEVPEELLEEIRRAEWIKTGGNVDRKAVAQDGQEKGQEVPDHELSRRDVVITDNLLVSVDAAEDVLAACYPPRLEERSILAMQDTLYQVSGTGDGFSCTQLYGSTCRELLSGAARWKLAPEMKQILPPVEIVSALLRRGSWTKIPRLERIERTPSVQPDGSVSLERGYVASRSTWSEFDPEPYLAHKRPVGGCDSARRAAEDLLNPFMDFPLKTDQDKAALLCLILSIVGRDCVEGEIPVYGIRSPVRGTGKTLLGRAACMIATGEDPALQQAIESPECFRKNLFAAAIAGDRILFLDNQDEGAFGNVVLSSCVTSGYIEDRILGKSEKKKVPWRAVVIVTGNQLRYRKDQGRRTVTIDLDACLERPESRDLSSFAYTPLLSHVKKYHQQLFMAAAHILECHAAMGCPRVVKQGLGGFESWDARIRQAVCWAMGFDALQARFTMKEDSDEEAERIIEFMLGWKELVGVDTQVRCSELCATTNDKLLQMLIGFVGAKPLNPQTLGTALHQIRDRPLSGLAFRARKTKGLKKWFLVKVGADPVALRRADAEAARKALAKIEAEKAEAEEAVEAARAAMARMEEQQEGA